MAMQITILEFSVVLATVAFVCLSIYCMKVLKRVNQLVIDLQVKSNQADSLFYSINSTGQAIQQLSWTLEEEGRAKKERIGSILAVIGVGMELYQTIKKQRRDAV